MAAPNIVGVTTITGITTALFLTTASQTLLSNPSGSNSVFKINTIAAGNRTGATANVNVYLRSEAAGVGVTYAIANAIDVATKSSLVIVDKASSFYLEENRSITATASANSAIDLVLSYELIQ